MRSMASSPSSKGIAAIVGVGPKLGRSIARKFAHEGYTLAILSRDLGQYINNTRFLSMIISSTFASIRCIYYLYKASAAKLCMTI